MPRVSLFVLGLALGWERQVYTAGLEVRQEIQYSRGKRASPQISKTGGGSDRWHLTREGKFVAGASLVIRV
jgi:hypothetical protein